MTKKQCLKYIHSLLQGFKDLGLDTVGIDEIQDVLIYDMYFLFDYYRK